MSSQQWTSSLRMSLIAAVTLMETIAARGFRVRRRRWFEELVVNLILEASQLSAIASLRRRTVAQISEPPLLSPASEGRRAGGIKLESRSVVP